jgi:hypothetical protein
VREFLTSESAYHRGRLVAVDSWLELTLVKEVSPTTESAITRDIHSLLVFRGEGTLTGVSQWGLNLQPRHMAQSYNKQLGLMLKRACQRPCKSYTYGL